jgi:phosphopantothenoylcysteine synthetase/decarboxylase
VPPNASRVLTIVVCGAGPAAQVGTLVRLAQERGWMVGVVATPAAVPFLDLSSIEEQTGGQVRSEHRNPKESGTRSLPAADAVIVAPGSYNTICKLALGVSDTYALGVLAEAIGMRVPVVILPFVNEALARRAPFARAVESLREEGVRVLLGADEWLPHPPGTGDSRIATFPWVMALDAAEAAVTRSTGA